MASRVSHAYFGTLISSPISTQGRHQQCSRAHGGISSREIHSPDKHAARKGGSDSTHVARDRSGGTVVPKSAINTRWQTVVLFVNTSQILWGDYGTTNDGILL